MEPWGADGSGWYTAAREEVSRGVLEDAEARVPGKGSSFLGSGKPEPALEVWLAKPKLSLAHAWLFLHPQKPAGFSGHMFFRQPIGKGL